MQPLNRRTLLAGIAASGVVGSSGCLGDSRNLLGNNPDPEEFRRGINVVDVDDLPATVPLSVDMTTDPDEITKAGPAYLVLTVKHVGEEPVEFQRLFYKDFSGQHSDEGLAVWSPDAPDSPTEDEAIYCIENRGESPKEHRDYSHEGIPAHTLDSDESETIQFIVSMDWGQTDCFPPGEYRFESSPSAQVGDTDQESFDWGFTVEIVE